MTNKDGDEDEFKNSLSPEWVPLAQQHGKFFMDMDCLFVCLLVVMIKVR